MSLRSINLKQLEALAPEVRLVFQPVFSVHSVHLGASVRWASQRWVSIRLGSPGCSVDFPHSDFEGVRRCISTSCASYEVWWVVSECPVIQAQLPRCQEWPHRQFGDLSAAEQIADESTFLRMIVARRTTLDNPQTTRISWC